MKEATKGPGMSLRGEKYLRRIKTTARSNPADASRACNTVTLRKDSSNMVLALMRGLTQKDKGLSRDNLRCKLLTFRML